MSENNLNGLNEQEIAELYGDIINEPIQVAAFRDGCAEGWYCVGGDVTVREGLLGVRTYRCNTKCDWKLW